MSLTKRAIGLAAASACAVAVSVAAAPAASASAGQCGFDGKFCLWTSTGQRGGYQGLTGPVPQLQPDNGTRSYANQSNVNWCVWDGPNYTGPVVVNAPAGATGDIPPTGSSAGPC